MTVILTTLDLIDVQEVVSVCPESGVMPLHLSGGTLSNKLIQVEFSPRYMSGA